MTKCEMAICQLAVNVYGKTSQCTVCMEEMAELTKEDVYKRQPYASRKARPAFCLIGIPLAEMHGGPPL